MDIAPAGTFADAARAGVFGDLVDGRVAAVAGPSGTAAALERVGSGDHHAVTVLAAATGRGVGGRLEDGIVAHVGRVGAGADDIVDARSKLGSGHVGAIGAALTLGEERSLRVGLEKEKNG